MQTTLSASDDLDFTIAAHRDKPLVRIAFGGAGSAHSPWNEFLAEYSIEDIACFVLDDIEEGSTTNVNIHAWREAFAAALARIDKAIERGYGFMPPQPK